MRCEWPVLTKCCFCIPLRRGLLAWGYFKLTLNISLITFLAIQLYEIVTHIEDPLIAVLILSIIIAVNAIDATFQILFIISTHKKIYKYMRWYYRYHITILVIVGLGTIVNIVYFVVLLGEFIFFIFFIPWAVTMTILTFLYLFVHFYFTILVRSEFMKLKNTEQFQFVNLAAEARCTAVSLSEAVP